MDAIGSDNGAEAAVRATASALERLRGARQAATAGFASTRLAPREFLRAAMNFQVAVLEQPDRLVIIGTGTGTYADTQWLDGDKYAFPDRRQLGESDPQLIDHLDDISCAHLSSPAPANRELATV